MLPRPTIEAFDAWLTGRSIRFEAIVIGGSALALLGIIERTTRDFDILQPELSEEILQAAQEFASKMRSDGVDLADDWLNNGPMQLADILPRGWPNRLRVSFKGGSLTLRTLGPADLLKTKLFALCDRGIDLKDCIALAPSAEDLSAAQEWLNEQDANPLWPDHVRATLADLGRRLDHGV